MANSYSKSSIAGRTLIVSNFSRTLALLVLAVLCFTSSCRAALHDLEGRAEGSLLDRGADLPHLRLRSDDPTTTSSSEASSTSSSTATTSKAPLPSPFDTSIGSNFTEASCPAFFDNFLGNSTFKSCTPFSLLLQNSRSFFQASSSNDTLNPVLDAGCAASYYTCAPLMSSLATQLISSANCAADYSLRNPLVVQAYRGLLSYAPMYNASCLKADPTGRSQGKDFPYCYTSSYNSSSAADSMLYFLPLGLSLPGRTSISCSTCTQKTMAIYSDAASNTNSPLSKEYLPAADMINSACGANFVNSNPSTIKASSTSAPNAAGRTQASLGLLLLCMTAVLLGPALG